MEASPVDAKAEGEGKFFFFEKKKQKTFVNLHCATR
jgi:hypothetical protein